MASDSWARMVSSSKRHQKSTYSQFDLYLGFEDMETGEDDSRVEFSCPFCSEDFDVVGLCCHIDDEHPVEAKSGVHHAQSTKVSFCQGISCRVCPVCAARVGMDLVGHITMQHGNFFKLQRRRKNRRGFSGSHSAFSLLKKELRDGHHLHSLLGGTSQAPPSLSSIPDPLLSSFINNLPPVDSPKDVESAQHDEDSFSTNSLEAIKSEVGESSQPALSDGDQKERAQRSEFVQEILWSTIFPDSL